MTLAARALMVFAGSAAYLGLALAGEGGVVNALGRRPAFRSGPGVLLTALLIPPLRWRPA